MSTKKTDPTLQKCNELIDRLNELKKAIGQMNVASNRKPANALGTGWSQDGGTGAFHHSTHGVISTFKNPKGGFDVRHNGEQVGSAKNIGEAGSMIRNHVGNLGAPRVAMKADDEPYWSDASKRKQQKINREMDFKARTPGATTPTTNDPKSINPIKPTTVFKPGVSGKISKEEDEMDKSGYGPKLKEGSLYDPKVNDSRKRNNIESAGRVPGAGGPNASIKAYSTTGRGSAKEQAAAEQKKVKKLSGPVRQYSPAEIAALEEARKLKKNTENAPWDQHNAIPNADQQVELYKRVNPAIPGEDAMAMQLAGMMNSKAMMRPDHRQPSSEEMIMAGQAMGLVPTEEMQKAQEQQWGGAINNWLVEASKPISSRFQSEEEELAYWSSIKVNGGKTGGDFGF
jgi:hypothetical protein